MVVDAICGFSTFTRKSFSHSQKESPMRSFPNPSIFEGSLTALITPFRNGELDESAVRRLVDFQIDNGTRGLVPCGTTGESVTMTETEQNRVIELVIDQAAGRVPVLAGTGTNNTAVTIERT